MKIIITKTITLSEEDMHILSEHNGEEDGNWIEDAETIESVFENFTLLEGQEQRVKYTVRRVQDEVGYMNHLPAHEVN